jgi:hypothetical protein
MKRIFLTLILVTVLMAVCAPLAGTTSQPGTMATLGEQAAAITTSAPTAQNSTTATAKPRGKVTQPAPASTDTRGKVPKPSPTSANPDLIAPPVLWRPTDNSITANVVPAQAIEIYYEYGTTPGEYTGHTELQTAAAGVPLETLIVKLEPNARYYYRIRYGSAVGAEGMFMTQRASGSTFTFGIQGDSHPERENKQFDAGLYTRTLLSAAADHPDFYIAIGDDFSVDQLKTVNAQTVAALYIAQRQWLGLVGAPVFLVNGNHEQASLANLDGTANNVAVWAQTARNAYFPQPAPDGFYTGDSETVEFIGQLRDYYAFTWGDALFVVIDPYWHSNETVDNQFGAGSDANKVCDLWNVTLGEEQYQWLKRTLESSTARWKFVFAHHVNGTGRGGIELADSYEWGDASHLAAHRPGWDQTIHQLMAANGVTIFFQGHDHLFARQELDGVIYQTLPEPANPFYTLENAAAYTSGDLLPNSGYLRVTVSLSGVTVDYIRIYLDQPDELAFSYTVP